MGERAGVNVWLACCASSRHASARPTAGAFRSHPGSRFAIRFEGALFYFIFLQ